MKEIGAWPPCGQLIRPISIVNEVTERCSSNQGSIEVEARLATSCLIYCTHATTPHSKSNEVRIRPCPTRASVFQQVVSPMILASIVQHPTTPTRYHSWPRMGGSSPALIRGVLLDLSLLLRVSHGGLPAFRPSLAAGAASAAGAAATGAGRRGTYMRGCRCFADGHAVHCPN